MCEIRVFIPVQFLGSIYVENWFFNVRLVRLRTILVNGIVDNVEEDIPTSSQLQNKQVITK